MKRTNKPAGLFRRGIALALCISMLSAQGALGEAATPTDLPEAEPEGPSEVMEVPAEETPEAAFAPHYARLSAGTVIFEDERLKTELGVLDSTALVWVLGLDEDLDTAAVVLACGGDILQGHVRTAALKEADAPEDATVTWQGIPLTEAALSLTEQPREEPETVTPATDTDLPQRQPVNRQREEPVTLTDLDEQATAMDLDESFFTCAMQSGDGKALLTWRKVSGAKSYIVSYGKVTRIVTALTLTVSKLPVGDTTFTVLPCSDKKGKKPLGMSYEARVTIASWSWASPFRSKFSVTAVQLSADEAVTEVTWQLKPGWQRGLTAGFELVDKKKTVLARYTLEELLPADILENGTEAGCAVTVRLTLPLGSHQLYVRPYAIALNGTRMAGGYCGKPGKLKVAVAWRSKKLTLKLTRTEEQEVTLSWNAVSGADGYAVAEKNGKSSQVLCEAAEPGLVLTDVSYDTHTYLVQPFRINALGDREEGTASAAVSIRVRPLWMDAPKVTARQTADRALRLEWTVTKPADSYEVSMLKSGRYRVIAETADRYLELTAEDGLKNNTTYMFRVMPVKDGITGDVSKTASIKLLDAWKVAPVLTVAQTDEDALTLTWEAIGDADLFRIIATGCKPATK